MAPRIRRRVQDKRNSEEVMKHKIVGLMGSENRAFTDPDGYENSKVIVLRVFGAYKTLLREVYEIEEETNTTIFKVKQKKGYEQKKIMSHIQE